VTTASRDELALVCHPRGTIQRVLSGNSAQVHVGAPLTELLLAESWVRCQRLLQIAARQGACIDGELTVLGPDGPHALRFAALRISPEALLVVAARDAETLLSLLGAACDPQQGAIKRSRSPGSQRALDELTRVNSELVNNQRALAKEQAATHAQARQRQELLATVAHDLRTPMAAVLGYCELLGQTGGHPSDATTGMVQRVCATVQYALSLLSQTLDYAKVDSGTLTLRLAQTDLRELTSVVIEMHSALAAAKNIRIALLDGHAAVPPAWVDRVLIQQTIGNLLSNAIKYSPQDTSIEVRVSREDADIALSIRDQGLGIEPALLPLIFRPFQTTSTRGTAGEKSTGLGLAIVQKLVAAHGGTVHVQSTPQHGSTFVVKLPIRPRESAPGIMVLPEHESERGTSRPSDAARRP
jgi:two-component system, OmpR family, sensor kinase